MTNRPSRILASLMAVLIAPIATADPGGIDGTFNGVVDPRRLPVPLRVEAGRGPGDAKGLPAGPSRAAATGHPRFIIRLIEPSVADRGISHQAARAARDAIREGQDALVRRLKAIDPAARLIGGTQLVMNAVVVEASEEAIVQISQDPAVARVAPVGDYRLDLSETVPYIGATSVQQTGYDGTGVRVAVLDSGVDFTHKNLSGPATVAFYGQCYGKSPDDPAWSLEEPHNGAPVGDCAGYFGPGAPKVVGGFDFVGERWPNEPERPDPNPIDFAGHGTHVADIIGGVGGVAPGASLYAVKVCSAMASRCSGVGLIQGMEFAVDPNGDGDPSDAVDIINMSLGSAYGQPVDDYLSFAIEGAARLGVLTVASAGNSSDKPFVSGTPAATDAALSVAQTAVPSAVSPLLEVVNLSGLGPYQAVFQPWSVALSAPVQGSLQYGNGAGGNLDGCQAFTARSLTGKIVLVDRGICNFSLKVANIGAAGGSAAVIGLITPGDPFEGGSGGEAVSVPGFMISQADAIALKGTLGAGEVSVRFDPNRSLPLVGSMVGSSSRGPAMQTLRVKPEIGAPGASVSAVVGSGDGTLAFSGTSGAAPMVAGAAALIHQAYPDRGPVELKAVLINTAETEIFNLVTMAGGVLAPISRIGGGEVRVDQALNASAAAWVHDEAYATLSFGFHEVTRDNYQLSRRVAVRNYSDHRQTFSILPSFRFAADEQSLAVKVLAPSSIVVGAGRTAYFNVTLSIDAARLPAWGLNSGARGADGAALTAVEYDGYLTLKSGDGAIHLPWQVLPRAAGQVRKTGRDGLWNLSIVPARLEAYHLVASSPNLPHGRRGLQHPMPDLRHVGYATTPGGCGEDGDLFAFAVNTWERQTHANAPAILSAFLDVDGDGQDDFQVLTQELARAQGGAPWSDGRNAAWIQDVLSGSLTSLFFTDHDTNSANTVMNVCSRQLGASAGALGKVRLRFVAYDGYFTGNETDRTEPVTVDLQAVAPRIADSGSNSYVLAPQDGTRISGVGTKLVLVRGGAPGLGEAIIVP